MDDRLMVIEELKDFLRVSRQALFDWRENGHLTADYNFGTINQPLHIYLHSSIDRFLYGRAIHPKHRPPRISKLLAYQAQTGLPALLTIAEVEARWDVGHETISNLLAKGIIPGLALTTEVNTKHNRLIRIPAPSLSRVVAITDHPNVVTGRFAAKMLAIGKYLFSEVIKHKLLEPVRVVSSKRQTYVSTASLRHLLDSLVRNCTVDEWWKMQLDHDFSDIVTKSEALRRLHMHHRRLTAAMEQSIPYIKLPLSTDVAYLRLPFYIVNQWYETERRRSPAEIALIFGIAEELATRFMNKRAFCSAFHPPSKACPRISCIHQYIQSHRIGNAFTATDWLLWVHEDHMIPRSLPAGVQLNQYTICEAELKGVLLPNGATVFAPHSIAALFTTFRKERLEERRTMGI